MTNLEKLDTLPELQRELEQAREARKRLERALSDAEGRATDWQRRCCEETARAEQAEERIRVLVEVDIDALNRAVNEEASRAEQAEQERDEARRISRDMGAIISDTMAALEGDPHDNMVGLARALRGDLKRAEADNAALLDDSRTGLMFWHGNACAMAGGAYPSDPGECSDAICREWMERIRSAHPGAALLEYVRALENVIRDVRRSPMDGEDSDYARGYGDGFTKRGAVMRAAADALKGTS